MRVTLDADRVIIQHGTSPGERDGCTIEAVDAATAARILAALGERPDGGTVTLAADHADIAVHGPSPAWLAAEQGRQAARAQRRADLATIAAHPDPAYRALARVLGLL